MINFFVFLAVFISVASTPAHAQNIWERMFPSFFENEVPQGPSPEETLQAPFQTNIQNAPKSDLFKTYDTSLGTSKIIDGTDIRDLSNAHRSKSEVTVWSEEAVGVALNFSVDDLQKFGAVVRPYFTASGLDAYKNFLSTSGIVPILRKNNKKLSTYISQSPIIKQNGTSENIYKWVVDVPVLLSYVDIQQKENNNVQARTQEATIRIQVARVRNTKRHPEGMAIENWKIVK